MLTTFCTKELTYGILKLHQRFTCLLLLINTCKYLLAKQIIYLFLEGWLRYAYYQGLVIFGK